MILPEFESLVISRAQNSKFVLVFVITVSPVCIQHFITERDRSVIELGSTRGFGGEQRLSKATIIKVRS